MTEELSRLIIDERNGATILQLKDKDLFDHQLVDEVKDLMCAIIQSIDPPHVVVDMVRVEAVGSVFMGSMNLVSKQVKARQGQMRIACMAEPVYLSFKIASLTSLFKIHDTVDEAIEQLG